MKNQYIKLIKGLFEEVPESTDFQKQIERNVTNGLGYDSRTTYVEKEDKLLIGFIKPSNIKNSHEGLKIHLAEMDNAINPSQRLTDIISQYKQVARDIESLPYMQIVDSIPTPDYNKKARMF